MSASAAIPAITLTANLQAISGTSTAGSKLRVTLIGFGSDQPTIMGAAALSPISEDYPFQGQELSIPVWGNDVISPSGTRYMVQFIDPKGTVIAANEYKLIGAGVLDLSLVPTYDPDADGTTAQGVIYTVFARGLAATFTVGTVAAAPTGTAPSITNSGTDTDAVLNFLLPAGPPGTPGLTGPQGPPSLFSGAFSMAATYAKGQTVSFTDGTLYASLQSGNTGNQPGQSPTWWGVQVPAASPTHFTGPYSASTTYAADQAVSYNGSSYVSLQASNTGNAPDAAGSTFWALQAAQGAPGSLTLTQVAAIRAATPIATTSPNLFNAATTSNGFIQHGTGALIAHDGYYASDFMPANSGGQMASNTPMFGNDGANGDGIGYYDANRNWISNDGSGYAAGAAITIPAAAAFMRVTIAANNTASGVMIVNGTTPPAAYVGYGVYPASTIDTKLAALEAQIGAGSQAPQTFTYPTYLALQAASPAPKNLFDYTQCISGFVQHGTGNVITLGGYLASGFFLANAGGQMVANLPLFGNDGAHGDGIGYYDINQNWLSNDGTGYAANTPFSVPANAVFMRVTTKQGTTDTTKLMVVAGTVLPQAYQSANLYPGSVVDAKLAAVAALITPPSTLNGTSTSDAVTPDQATTLVELASYIATRTLAPTSYTMPTSTRTLYAYGDSLTAGYGANGVDSSTAFPAVMGPALGISTVNNYGQSTDEAPDTSLKIWGNPPQAPATALYTMMIGSTESLHQGASYLPIHKAAHLANAAWLTSGASACIDLTAVNAANWSNYTALAGATGRQCSTNGAAISYQINTYGKPIYLFNLVQDGNPGTFNVSVDGGSALALQSYASQTISTPNGATSYVQVTFIPVAAGNHTVTITQTSSGGSVVIMALGTALRHAYYGAVLLCGGMIPVQGDGIRLLSAQYTMNVIDNVRILQGYGADIRFVDTRSVIKASNSAIYLAAGNPHLTPVGYAMLAQPYITTAQRPPAPEVAKFTPASASSPATPGETWDDGVYRYRGTPTGTTTRTAAAFAAW